MKTFKVLHADDDEEISKLIKAFLELAVAKKPYKIEHVAVKNGEEFLNIYGPNYAFMITDESMPIMHGLEVLLELHAQGKLLPEKTALYCTIPSKTKDFETITTLGVRHYEKPDKYRALVQDTIAHLDKLDAGS